MKVDLLVSRYPRMIGLARYAACLEEHLSRLDLDYSRLEPAYPLSIRLAHQFMRPFGYDVQAFCNTFPVSAAFTNGGIKHFTTQMMASLLSFRHDLKPVIVTVHDIVPYMMRDDPEQGVYRHFVERHFDRLAMLNLRRADQLIAISSFTRDMLIERLGCSPEKVQVILYGLDHDLFRQVAVTAEFRQKYGLDDYDRHILYVGSENPRKNLPRLIQAFAKVTEQIPDLKLLKVGTPEYMQQYYELQKLIREYELEDSVVFINHPTQQELVAFYNLADVFVFPSLYEGFGMPPLEAMACGTPVVTSNSSSLPEVAGEAAILVDPYNVDEIAAAMRRVLEDHDLAQDLRERGLARAAKFSWERTARETIAVYERVMAGK